MKYTAAGKYMNIKVFKTKQTAKKSDGFIAFQHATEWLPFGGFGSLKTWASGEVPRAAKLRVTCPKGKNSKILLALEAEEILINYFIEST